MMTMFGEEDCGGVAWQREDRRLAREQQMMRDGEADWATLEDAVGGGAQLQFDATVRRYVMPGIGSVGEEFAWWLVRRRLLWPAQGPLGHWPLPVLGRPPGFPSAGPQQVMAALFPILVDE